MNLVEKTDDLVKVKQVLISVSDKSGLEEFIPQLLTINPHISILSTGGTYSKIKSILQESDLKVLQAVSDYTGQPETQGGLVKTLDFKIYLGLLTETYNSAHQQDLERTQARPIDMVIVNLYPFEKTIAQAGVTLEQARSNIDIGGPCMLRAAAKNFLRVMPVVDPHDYGAIITELKSCQGQTALQLRYQMARKAFQHTANYDRAIADYLSSQAFKNVYHSDCQQD